MEIDHVVLVVEHLTAEQGSCGQQQVRHAGTITLRTA